MNSRRKVELGEEYPSGPLLLLIENMEENLDEDIHEVGEYVDVDLVMTERTKIFHIVRSSSKKSFHIYMLRASLYTDLNPCLGEAAKQSEEHLVNVNNLFRKVLEDGTYNGIEDLDAQMTKEVQHYLGSPPRLSPNFSLVRFDTNLQYKMDILLAIGSGRFNIQITALRMPWGNTLQERASFQVARMAKSKENIALLEVPETVKKELNQFYGVISETEFDSDVWSAMVNRVVQALDVVKERDGDQFDREDVYEKLFNTLSKSGNIDFRRKALNEAFLVFDMNKECRPKEVIYKI